MGQPPRPGRERRVDREGSGGPGGSFRGERLAANNFRPGKEVFLSFEIYSVTN